MRHLAREDRRIREGGWNQSVGFILAGGTLGLLGFGTIGKRMAKYAQAFDMGYRLEPEPHRRGGR